MGDSSTSTNQTSTNKLDPKQAALFTQNYKSATDVANTPFTPYTGELVAGANPALNQSYGLVGDIANNNTGASTLNQGIGAVNSLTDGNIQNYMNPYTKNVTDTTMADLERSRQIAANSDAQRATAGGAFGGSRSGVSAALTNEAAGRTAASTFAGLNQAGYQNAQSTALNAGQLFGQLSQQQLSQALQRAQAVNTSGVQQQQTQQNQDAAAYQEFMRQLQYPQQQQNIKNQALAMLPQEWTQKTQGETTQSSGMGGLLGALGSLAGGIGSIASGGALGGLGSLFSAPASLTSGIWNPGSGGFPTTGFDSGGFPMRY